MRGELRTMDTPDSIVRIMHTGGPIIRDLSKKMRLLPLGWALVVSTLLSTTRALADPPPEDAPRPRAVRLEYSVPPGTECPDEETFKMRVRARMRFDPFAADAPARVIVKLIPAEEPGWVRGHAELRGDKGEVLWERDAL